MRGLEGAERAGNASSWGSRGQLELGVKGSQGSAAGQARAAGWHSLGLSHEVFLLDCQATGSRLRASRAQGYGQRQLGVQDLLLHAHHHRPGASGVNVSLRGSQWGKKVRSDVGGCRWGRRLTSASVLEAVKGPRCPASRVTSEAFWVTQ